MLILSNAEQAPLIVTGYEISLPGQLLGSPREPALSAVDPAKEHELPVLMDGDVSLTVPPGESRNLLVHFEVRPEANACKAMARRVLRRPRRVRVTLVVGGEPSRRMSVECKLGTVDPPLPPRR